MTAWPHSRRDWIVASGALMVAALVLIFGHGAKGREGSGLAVSITVVPSDAEQLNCRSAFSAGGARCAFDERNRPVTTSAVLRPYMTVARELVLLAGVFEEPHVASWLGQSKASGSQGRVTLECTGLVLGTAAHADVQWVPGSSWGIESDVMVGRITHCDVRP